MYPFYRNSTKFKRQVITTATNAKDDIRRLLFINVRLLFALFKFINNLRLRFEMYDYMKVYLERCIF